MKTNFIYIYCSTMKVYCLWPLIKSKARFSFTHNWPQHPTPMAMQTVIMFWLTTMCVLLQAVNSSISHLIFQNMSLKINHRKPNIVDSRKRWTRLKEENSWLMALMEPKIILIWQSVVEQQIFFAGTFAKNTE